MPDPISLAQALIGLPSVTPDPGDALALIARELEALGFETRLLVFEEPETAPVPNLYARLGTSAPFFCFAGHTDVVPPGDPARWAHGPYSGRIVDGVLHGRGAADMKSALAAMVSAVEQFLASGPFTGSIGFLLTGDEEGPSVNGTRKLLGWLKERSEKPDYCLVGEPTNPDVFGEMIKIGRRGSLHGYLAAEGVEGHVAYPHLAANPADRLLALLAALKSEPLDAGNAYFQPSNLEILDLSTGNETDNLIPAEARARFNVRFNSLWTPETLKAEIVRRLDGTGLPYRIAWRVSGESFLTPPGKLTDAVADAVRAVTGRTPAFSTTGGTSDARFIKDVCPVVEFGLVGATMHKTGEQVKIDDVLALSRVYEGVLRRLLPR